ncbi:MAG: DUF362 domain-containing protein [Pseudomonadota bacterium]
MHKAAGTPARFHDMIVDVFRIRIPDLLFIVDAVTGMEGNGPASSELRDIGLILASNGSEEAISDIHLRNLAHHKFVYRRKIARSAGKAPVLRNLL